MDGQTYGQRNGQTIEQTNNTNSRVASQLKKMGCFEVGDFLRTKTMEIDKKTKARFLFSFPMQAKSRSL